jgi:hypothetical protein
VCVLAASSDQLLSQLAHTHALHTHTHTHSHHTYTPHVHTTHLPTRCAPFTSCFPQDMLEEAIAKAVVLPSWLARPLHLAPVEKRRRVLASQLASAVSDMWSGAAGGGPGSWTAAIRGMDRSDLPGFRDLSEASPSSSAPDARTSSSSSSSSSPPPKRFTADEAAELMIGLLFASHKNPGIGAAQALLFLLEPAHAAEAAAVESEILGVAAADVYRRPSSRPRERPDIAVLGVTPRLNACVLEALRLCSHSIGAVRKVVAPTGFRFSSSSGVEFALPQGAYIGISHIVPSLLSAAWAPDAAAFRPFGHFLDRPDGEEPDEYEMTAFSHGLHKCPGRRLATLMMTAALATLLVDYEAAAVGPVPPLSFERATLAQRAGPCFVLFRPRSERH